MHLPVARTSPRAARQFVDAVLHRWGRDGAIDRVALIASELVTNAVGQVSGEVWLAIEALDDVVRLEVGYGGELRNALALPIVEALASSWGRAPGDDRNYMWAEVRG